MDLNDIEDGTDVAGVSLEDDDPALNEFARGDGSLTLSPRNNDAARGTTSDLLVCFTSGTLIKTDCGAVAVEHLSVGDLVLTADRGYQAVRWIGSRRLDAIDLRMSPKLRPIRVRAGALGKRSPEQDLMVSPQHRVLVRSKIAKRMFGSHEVLAAAKHLLHADGVDVAEDFSEVEYWHFMFDEHEIVFSNGAQTESLYTGAEALKSVGAKAREEIFALFPGSGTSRAG